MSKCIQCGEELTTGGCANPKCPSKGSTGQMKPVNIFLDLHSHCWHVITHEPFLFGEKIRVSRICCMCGKVEEL